MKTIINSSHSLTLVSKKALHVVRVDFDRDYLAADVFHHRIGGFDVSNTRVLFHNCGGEFTTNWHATGPRLAYKAGVLFCQSYNGNKVWGASFSDKFFALHSLYCPEHQQEEN